MKGKKLIFIFFDYPFEACIEILQIFLIFFLVFHELSSQHVLENLNSKTTIVPWQLWHKLYIFFNPNIFEIFLFTKTNFFVKENEKNSEIFWNISF
jgi:hypothetical protein